jgi:hypothetical protein
MTAQASDYLSAAIQLIGDETYRNQLEYFFRVVSIVHLREVDYPLTKWYQSIRTRERPSNNLSTY